VGTHRWSTAKAGRLVYGAAALAGVTLLVSACGGGPAKSAAAPTTTTTAKKAAPVAQTNTTPASTNAFGPAATGKIASITGPVLEVQGSSGQTTVKVTSKTSMSGTVTAAMGDIAVGACLSVQGTKAAGGGVDATSVEITSATNGNCFGGFGGAGGSFPGGRTRGTGSTPDGGGFPPGGGTGGRTSRSFPGRTGVSLPANFATATGKVTAISGSKLTVDAVQFARPAATATGTSTTTTAPGAAGRHFAFKTTPETVALSTKTKYTKEEKMTLSSLKVGECATAFGTTNDIGAVTATRLTVSPGSSGDCTVTFRFGGPGGFGGRGGAGGGFPTGAPTVNVGTGAATAVKQ
jgi:Domain of unknown function (DUF5666)